VAGKVTSFWCITFLIVALSCSWQMGQHGSALVGVGRHAIYNAFRSVIKLVGPKKPNQALGGTNQPDLCESNSAVQLCKTCGRNVREIGKRTNHPSISEKRNAARTAPALLDATQRRGNIELARNVKVTCRPRERPILQSPGLWSTGQPAPACKG